MSIRINYNSMAMIAQRSLSQADRSVATVMERLSSGSRIQRSSDDPAGLVLANLLRYHRGGVETASNNLEEGISLLQTAEGALDQVTTILQRIRTLAVAAASTATGDPNQLGAMQRDLDAAVLSLSDIATGTTYADLPLLTGSLADNALLGDAATMWSSSRMDATRMPGGVDEGSQLTLGAPSLPRVVTRFDVPAAGLPIAAGTALANLSIGGVALDDLAGKSLSITGSLGTASIPLTAATTAGSLVAAINAAGTGVTASFDTTTGELQLADPAGVTVSSPNISRTGHALLLSQSAERERMTMSFLVGGVPALADDVVQGSTGNGTLLDAVAGKTITVTGLAGTRTYTLSNTTTFRQLADAINGDSARTGVRAQFSNGALQLEGSGFGIGGISVSSQDMTSAAAGVGVLDTATASAFANPLMSARETFSVAYTDATGPVNGSSLVSNLVDGATQLSAAVGKKWTINGNGTSATLAITATTSLNDVVAWVNSTAAATGARASLAGGTLTIAGMGGPIMVESEDLSGTGVGLLDRAPGSAASAGTAQTGTGPNPPRATMEVTFVDASGSKHTVTLTQIPSLLGPRFVNLLPGPESAPPYTGWLAGGIIVDARDLSTGAFGSAGSVSTADAYAKRSSSTSLQIGAGAGQHSTIEIPDVRAAALGRGAGLAASGLATVQALVDNMALVNGRATEALAVVDAALKEVGEARGMIGAQQANSLETTLDSLRSNAINLQTFESTLRDTDMAKDAAEFTRSSIMMQAATAMLAQANQVPQTVLQLLK